MKIKSVLSLAISAALILPVSAWATNGYQLIGIGAYEKSLAGAVTANPGSAMAAVSNPAGAARVGSRADFSMEAFMPSRSVDFSGPMGGGKGDSAADMYGVPAIGWTAPVADGSNLYFGGGMYGTSGMGVDYASTMIMPGTYWEGYSNLSFWQMAPVLAMNVDNRLSVGASLNIDYQAASFKMRMSDGAGNVGRNFDLSRGASGFGYGISLGALYDLTKSLTIGVTYKSKQEFAPMDYQLGYGDITDEFGNPQAAGTYSLDLDFPQQAAVGVAFDASPALTVSADIKWIDWSSTMNKLAVKGPYIANMDPGWSDQTVYALGVAYKLNSNVNLRAGYNYAEAPFDASKVMNNLILPAIVETHYTVGGDVKLNNHWELAFHYMYVPENTLMSNTTGARISLSETSAGVNIGYRF